MSKKQMTPEMRAEKLERKKTKRSIFGKTFIKAFGWFISIVLVFTVALIAFKPAPKVQTLVASGGSSQGGSGQQRQQNSGTSGGSSSQGGNGGAQTGGGTKTDAKSGGDSASAVDTINSAMAKAAGASYKWTRTGRITEAVDVGNATGTLDKIISGVDPNANLNSVIGGFLGAKGDTVSIDVKAGQTPPDPNEPDKDCYHWAQYALKQSKLTADDLQNLNVSGNNYSFDLNQVKNPEADNSGFSRFTNDFVTLSMISEEVSKLIPGGAVGVKDMDADYGPCHVEMTIEDGKLTSMKYNYTAKVNSLGVKVLFATTKGTGAFEVKAEYSNFSY